MKLKSTLWAFAIACAAVSCSDDEIISGPSNENGGESNTASAKMLVTINTGVTTKADGNTAENGDVFEVGSEAESQVRDLTVFLYAIVENTQDETALTSTTTIAATGYSAVDNTTQSKHPANHGWQAEVQIAFKNGEASQFAGKKYGVLAVTNLGSTRSEELTRDNTSITTIGALADYIQDAYKTEGVGFVMSTHMMKDESGHTSVVTFPESTATQTIPEVEVFVERLAAKIRINKAENITDFTYSIGEGKNPDKVTLNAAAVINQLSSGSYMLKRVSKTYSEGDLGDEGTETEGKDQLIADEVYGESGYNWVIDPWTRAKASETVFTKGTDGTYTITMPTSGSTALVYQNYLFEKIGDAYPSYGEFWKSRTEENTDVNKKSLTGDQIHLAYTMENTMKTAEQSKGFATGVMFNATYKPGMLAKIQEDNKSVNVVATTEGEDATTFYTYGLNQAKFESLDAIFAYELALLVPSTGTAGDLLFYDSFVTTGWSNLTVEAFNKFVTAAGDRLKDSFGYIAYLKGFVPESLSDGAKMSTQTKDEETAKSFTDYIAKYTSESAEALPNGIKEYKNGECYYFYWIRHEDNKQQNKMDPMEYAIVRNNIYDLTVTGISGLGEAGATVIEPIDPVEDETAKMNVTVKVKNWVVRQNNDIIL